MRKIRSTARHIGWTASAVAGLMALAGTASAAPPSTPAYESDVVNVVGSATTLTAPGSLSAGITTFRVSTTDPDGLRLGMFRLRAGVPVDTLMADLRLAVTARGNEAVEAGRRIEHEATMLGGAFAVPGSPASFVQVLLPGTYYLIDYQDFDIGLTGTPHAMRVNSAIRNDLPSAPTAAISMVDTADGPRFRAPRSISSTDTIVVTNRTDALDEAIFMAVRPDTTPADVQHFFEALDRNQPISDVPFIDTRPRGMPVITRGWGELIQPGLPPGRYALVTWLPGPDGHLLAATGTYALLTIT